MFNIQYYTLVDANVGSVYSYTAVGFATDASHWLSELDAFFFGNKWRSRAILIDLYKWLVLFGK